MMSEINCFPKLERIEKAMNLLEGVVVNSPLLYNQSLSEQYGASIYLKREDLQSVRSYKIRGAFNKISSLSAKERIKGVVCASAGNHAQGVAYSCNVLDIKGTIFMPTTTPKQKVLQVKMFGKSNIKVILTGDTFDDSFREARKFCDSTNGSFIHPFDDISVIEGQATIGIEILKDFKEELDYLVTPVGGGGLASGVGWYFKQKSPQTKIIGAEPSGALSMKQSIENKKITELNSIDTFVDGAAVKRPGVITFEICKNVIDKIIPTPEGSVCSAILELYNRNAIVAEPAGALSVAALEFIKEEIHGKNVVCIISGSNNDISRTEEIRERSLMYEGLKHYFIVRFPQRAGALLNFVNNVLGPNDDITHFSYSKKTNREQGPALIGIELSCKNDLSMLLDKLYNNKIIFEYINDKKDLFGYLI
ncbi:MAG: threonine ammonia-lyase [Bacteroidales bacterium]|nr:threonine ammonia-lyase [Bacteroidales bacterium]MDD3299350.1 threonine ammonia-lyase [Bacteroidales bacterium]MDD3843802.1 threonine ammonia-lyase [Bacteroidales bacterium]